MWAEVIFDSQLYSKAGGCARGDTQTGETGETEEDLRRLEKAEENGGRLSPPQRGGLKKTEEDWVNSLKSFKTESTYDSITHINHF